MDQHKLKDIDELHFGNIFFRKNYKEYAFKFAWKKTGHQIDGKELVCKWKGCRQDLMDPNETVYF